MGYRIDYQGPKKVRGLEKRTVSAPAVAGLLVLAAAALVCGLWPQGVRALRGLLIPGDAAVTVGALEALAADLGAGESLRDAFLDFCYQVMGLGAA